MKQQALLTQNIYGLFAKYCATSVLGMTGISLYILADTFFIANGVGTMGIAALNIVLPLYSLIYSVGHLIGIGGATYASLESGRGNTEKRGQIYSFCLITGTGFGLFFAAGGLFFAEPILALMGASAETMPLALEYYRVIILFAPMFILDNIFLAFVRNDHRPQLAMASQIGGSLFNILMDYVLMFPLGLGMFGAALATAISPIVGILILSGHLFSKRCSFRFRFQKLQTSFIRPIIAGGSSSFVTELAAGIVIFAFNLVLLPLGGSMAIAAYGIIANFSVVVNAVFVGIGQAMQPLVSVNFGAGQKKRAMQVLGIGLGAVLLFGALAYGLCVLFAPQFVAVFNREGSAALAELTQRGLLLYGPVYLPMGVCIVISLFLQAVLCMKYALTISLLRGILLTVPAVYLLSQLFGMDGVWAAPFAADLATAAVAGWLLVRWNQKQRSEGYDLS